MAASFTNTEKVSLGSIFGYLTEFAADSSYPTGGYAVTAAQFGARKLKGAIPIGTDGGYIYAYDEVAEKIKIYNAGEGAITPAGTNAAETAHTHAVALDTGASAAGSSHGHAFTGAASALNLASPVFSGTGYATAGQVITTTGNQTMTLNQCQGMLFMADGLASTAPVWIVSNTAVTGAPAVLTVVGTAPATDAGTYRIVSTIPVGTNAAEAAHTHGPGTLGDAASGAGSSHNHAFTGTAIPAGAADEVANATNLSALTGIPFLILAV